MAVAIPSLRYSYQEYARFETSAHERHEYVHGLILAMAGGTLEHSALCSKVIAALSLQLANRKCQVFDSNARVRVAASGNAYYPDASVVCDKLERDPEDAFSLINPSVIVEVLSPTTQSYDRSDNLEDYQRIPSLRHIVHVAHDQQRVDVWSREAGGWTEQSFDAHAPLPEFGVVLDVPALYLNPLA